MNGLMIGALFADKRKKSYDSTYVMVDKVERKRVYFSFVEHESDPRVELGNGKGYNVSNVRMKQPIARRISLADKLMSLKEDEFLAGFQPVESDDHFDLEVSFQQEARGIGKLK